MASARRAFIPNMMNVHLPSSEEYPGGRVVQLNQGWVELDDQMAAHPILARLMDNNVLPGETKRRERLHDAEMKRADAIGNAQREYAETVNQINAERLDETQEAGRQYEDRRAVALAKGASFNELHPDLDTRHAIALTAGPGMAVPAAAYAQPAVKADGSEAKLPKESEHMERMRRVTLGDSKPVEPVVEDKDKK